MALEKFRIFVDESPGNVGGGGGGEHGDDNNKLGAAQLAANKREPLGPRQPLGPTAMVVEQSQSQLLQQQLQNFQHQQQVLLQQVVSTSSALAPSNQRPLATLTSRDNLNAHSRSSSSVSINVIDEDQENDISMASLGSDFIPSVLHHEHASYNDESFGDLDDETELNVTSDSRNTDVLLNISCEEEFVCDEEDLIDESLGDENDEELAMELSQAFKQHDGQQIFNSKIYKDDILSYLHKLEQTPKMRPLANYMDFQNDITCEKRSILINWLVEVSDEFELQTETLFICVAIIDRFLSKMSIPTENLQLLGVAAMFTASKYEEIYPPTLFQFVEITDDTYSGQQICQMEQEILKTLEFQISAPTVTYFLRQIFAYNKFPKKVYHLAEYLCHLSLLADQPFLEYYPSEIALASVMLAAHQLGSSASISGELKEAYDKSNIDQFRRRDLPKGVKARDVDRRVYILNKELPLCIESLRAYQQRASSGASRLPSDSAIYQRYSIADRSSVSLLPALKIQDLNTI